MNDILAPLPPTSIPKVQCAPMTMADARHWIGSYNEWAETWNTHEKSRDLPLSPEWADAEYVHHTALPRSALCFYVRKTGQRGIMRFTKWRPTVTGWAYIRRPTRIDTLKWAGWII